MFVQMLASSWELVLVSGWWYCLVRVLTFVLLLSSLVVVVLVVVMVVMVLVVFVVFVVFVVLVVFVFVFVFAVDVRVGVGIIGGIGGGVVFAYV